MPTSWLPSETAALVHEAALLGERFFLVYLLALLVMNVSLVASALLRLLDGFSAYTHFEEERSFNQAEPAVSILAPAYNEELTIVDAVRSMLLLYYPKFEVIVICDGSRDRTFERLLAAFALVPSDERYEPTIATERVTGIYRSTSRPNLKVLVKLNGGKADALNAGLNLARHPLVCAIDGDSFIEQGSLARLARCFIERPETIAAGGTLRLTNGSAFGESSPAVIRAPGNWWARFQVVEYSRAFWIGRLGWTSFNAMLIISGAYGLFNRKAVVEVGGWDRLSVGEDMELVVRMHRRASRLGRPYHIGYVPDAICWTEAPETEQALRSQRIRWQRGLSQILYKHRTLLLDRQTSWSLRLAYLCFLLFEWLGPVFVLCGLVLMASLAILGVPDWPMWACLLALTYGVGTLGSLTALYIESVFLSAYKSPRDMASLVMASLLEPVVFRPRTVVWRLVALWRVARGVRPVWEALERKGLRKG